MNRLLCLLAAAVLLAAPAPAAAQTKEELKPDKSKPLLLRTKFSTYGFRHAQTVVREADGFHIRLPDRVPGIDQTGAYSLFTMAGDGEASMTFELLRLDTPRNGYGSSVGMAFDLGERVGRGSIQRRVDTKGIHGYSLECQLAGPDGKMEESPPVFVATKAKRGRMGLRRAGKELIFLTADDPKDPLKEVGRKPFTDRTIRSVRFFADPGGSPTAVDVRVKDIEMRAEEITGGVPKKEKPRSRWWWLWLALPAAGGGLLFWLWWARRQSADD